MGRWLKMMLIVSVVASWTTFVVLAWLSRRPSTAVWTVGLVAIVASVTAMATLIVWLTRWHDPRWDSPASQARAELWSKRGDGGNA